MRTDRDGLQMPVDHLLLVDQMRSSAQKLHERVYIVRPVIQDLLGILLLSNEVDDVGQSIHLGVHHLFLVEINNNMNN